MRVNEGVTQPVESDGHITPPQGLLHHIASPVTPLNGVVQGERLVLDTLSYG